MARDWLMATYGYTEDETISFLTVMCDFHVRNCFVLPPVRVKVTTVKALFSLHNLMSPSLDPSHPPSSGHPSRRRQLGRPCRDPKVCVWKEQECLQAQGRLRLQHAHQMQLVVMAAGNGMGMGWRR